MIMPQPAAAAASEEIRIADGGGCTGSPKKQIKMDPIFFPGCSLKKKS